MGQCAIMWHCLQDCEYRESTYGCCRHMNAEDAQFILNLRTFFQAINTMMAIRSDQVAQIHEPQVGLPKQWALIRILIWPNSF